MKTKLIPYTLLATALIAVGLWAQIPEEMTRITTASSGNIIGVKSSKAVKFSSATYDSDMDTFTLPADAKVIIQGKTIIDNAEVEEVMKALSDGAMYANSYANERELILNSVRSWSPEAQALTLKYIRETRSDYEKLRALHSKWAERAKKIKEAK